MKEKKQIVVALCSVLITLIVCCCVCGCRGRVKSEMESETGGEKIHYVEYK